MAYHIADADFLSRRALAVTGILALHVLIAYGLLTGLIQSVVAPEPKALVPTFVEDPPATPRPPQVAARVDLSNRRPQIEPLAPPQVITPEATPPVRPSQAGPDEGAPGGTLQVPEPLSIVGRNQMPDTQDYYPPALIRAGVEGASYVRVCVDEHGTRQGEPAIEQTSGNAQLDSSALNVARHGRYARALQGGAPVPTCFRFRIAFKLK